MRVFSSDNPHGNSYIMASIFARLLIYQDLNVGQIGAQGIPSDGLFHRLYQFSDPDRVSRFFGFRKDSDRNMSNVIINGGGLDWVVDEMVRHIHNAPFNDEHGGHYLCKWGLINNGLNHYMLFAKRRTRYYFYDPNCGGYFSRNLDVMKHHMKMAYYSSYRTLAHSDEASFECISVVKEDIWPTNLTLDEGDPDNYRRQAPLGLIPLDPPPIYYPPLDSGSDED